MFMFSLLIYYSTTLFIAILRYGRNIFYLVFEHLPLAIIPNSCKTAFCGIAVYFVIWILLVLFRLLSTHKADKPIVDSPFCVFNSCFQLFQVGWAKSRFVCPKDLQKLINVFDDFGLFLNLYCFLYQLFYWKFFKILQLLLPKHALFLN